MSGHISDASPRFFLLIHALAQFLLDREDVTDLEKEKVTAVLKRHFPDLFETMEELVSAACEEESQLKQLVRWVTENPLEAARELLPVRFPPSDSVYRGIPPLLFKPINDDEFGLWVRTMNCLHAEKVYYIYQLVQLSERDLLRMPNVGKRTLTDIKEALAKKDLSLSMKLSSEWVQLIERELKITREDSAQ